MAKRHERITADNYETPSEIAWWAVNHCMEISEKNCGKSPGRLLMLEPGCGDSAPFARSAAALGVNAFGIDKERHDEK